MAKKKNNNKKSAPAPAAKPAEPSKPAEEPQVEQAVVDPPAPSTAEEPREVAATPSESTAKPTEVSASKATESSPAATQVVSISKKEADEFVSLVNQWTDGNLNDEDFFSKVTPYLPPQEVA
eukprot:9499546-Pyramimonas_sp.AAC.1